MLSYANIRLNIAGVQGIEMYVYCIQAPNKHICAIRC